MKRFAMSVLAVVLVLVFVGESQAFSRSVQKVVVRQQAAKVVVQKQVIQKQVVVQEVQEIRVQKVVVQPVQAVVVQPVQAFYQVQTYGQVQAVQAYGYSGNCPQNVQLRQEIEALKLQVQKQELQQRLIVPK